MKNNIRLFSILFFMSISFSVLAQNSNSIYEVDFSKFDSINIGEMEFNANLLFLQKDYEKAIRLYLDIVNINIDDASSYYHLACCYAMIEKPGIAGNFLVLAINSGYNNYSQIKMEESFKLINKNKDFQQVLSDVLKYGEKYGETIFVNANVLIKSRVLLPKNFNPEKEYPLIIGLHGFGGVVENFSMINEYIEIGEYIFVVPEAPYFNSNLYNKKFQYSWSFRGTDKELWKSSDPEVMKYIINVVDEINKKYKISYNYLMGFSQGAAYAYATGIKNPDKIDAVIAIGGRLPDYKMYPWFLSKEDIERNNNIKVFIAHGKEDKVISYENAIKAKKILQKQEYKVELLLYDGGHNITKEVINSSLEWLSKVCK